jgi:exopolyphosphatase/guanosine-5'-triphosphate,3'-diphosphate pyrophosphatase
VTERQSPRVLAAVDLGSNSFHMVVAQVDDQGALRVVDRLKERVRLAGGLDDSGALTPEAQERALSCLGRFGERLRELPRGAVRVVGTNTLRKARNSLPFLIRARLEIGHPIEIISGREEARLIYLGVSSGFDREGRRLVVDIGGGSTELIVGDSREEPLALDSLYMGCVSWSLRYFPDGRLTSGGFERAITAARLEVEGLERRYRALRWEYAVGSSGTINAIEKILVQRGLSVEGITAEGLRRLRERALAAAHLDRLTLPGLSNTRRPVLPGGLAILLAVFEALDLQVMTATTSALREGVLHDLLGRLGDHDLRERTTDQVAERYTVDTDQATRVEATALDFFARAAGPWALDPTQHRALLSRAARLHELGMFVDHAGFHKHGAYILSRAHLPGFSSTDQRALAALVLGHRRALSRERLTDIHPAWGPEHMHLAVLLRLSARLHRSRSPHTLPPIDLIIEGGDALSLQFPEGWLDDHPLTRADLETEAESLAAAGLRLRFA